EAAAVVQAAMVSGVAQHKVDIEKYKRQLKKRIGKGRVIMSVVTDKAQKNPKRIAFPEGDTRRILRASNLLVDEGIAKPILLGNPDAIRRQAQMLKIGLEGVEIVDSRRSEKRVPYADKFFEKRCRKGVTRQQALRYMNNRTYFGLMMLEMGDCDAVLSGVVHDYPDIIRSALQIIDLCPSCSRVSGLFAMIYKDKVYMFADTTVNINPNAEELAEIAISASNVAKAFDIDPRVAMLSFSNFGSAQTKESKKVAEATAIVKKRVPDLVVEGEMQADTALMPELVERYFPFSDLKEKATVFIFPDLNAGNIAYKLLQRLGGFTAVGPILMGFSKPVHALHHTLDVNQIVDIASIAVVDAQALEKQK
ncbi:MAG: phosphate acyltransferase, partial [Waddliaceae bacterium]